MIEDSNTKELLTPENITTGSLADEGLSDTIDLGHNNSTQGVIYQMAEKSKIVEVEVPKSKGQTYYEEVEELKTKGVANADAVRQVAEKHGASENAVRGGIFQYRKAHVNGGSSGPTTTVRRLREKVATVDDLVANARQALQAALELIDKEESDVKAALDAAQARYDEVVASAADRKADMQKKLDALS
jgi:vacuolar-type H+-ATPase subunit I/STV1